MGFALLILVILVMGINYQNNLAYGLAFLLGSVFVVTILHTWRNLAGLILVNAGYSEVFAGEVAHFRMRLEGGGRSRQAVALSWNDTAEEIPLQLVDVDASNVVEILLTERAHRRGWLRPGRVRVETSFPLGLLTAWSFADLEHKALVYPRPVTAPLSTGKGEEGDEVDAGYDMGPGVDDFQGLRDYQPGDSMQRISWKAFSKEQGLFVKEFTALAGSDSWLDFNALSGDREYRLSVLCHWVLVFSSQGRAFGLRLPGLVLESDTGDRHKEEALRALALFGVEP